jgi:hypothetical protein
MASRSSSRWIQSVVSPDLPQDEMSDLKESTLASRAREGAREGAVTTREKSGQPCSARSSPRWQVEIASILRKAPGAAWRRERQETERQENGDRKISILKDQGFSGRSSAERNEPTGSARLWGLGSSRRLNPRNPVPPQIQFPTSPRPKIGFWP